MTVVLGIAIIVVTTLGTDQRHVTADAITDKIGAAKHALTADGATMTKLRAEIAAAANQEAALQKAIADLNTQITQTQGQVSDAQKQLGLIEAQLGEAQTSLVNTQTHLAFERRQLTTEIVVMYKAQNASNDFTNFLNSGDFNGLWQHVLDVHRLGSSEQELIATVTSDEQTIQDDVNRIATQKGQQKQLLAALTGIENQLSDALSTRKSAQQRLVALQASDQQKLAEMERATKELNAQIARLQAQEAAALAAGGGNGHFAWPETGPITQGFGCTSYPFEPYDPNCSTRHFHSGLDIAAPCGNNITVGDSGIAHTYYSSYGFGNHIIVVHGNGWVSVYGHMASFAVSDGQTVHRGQLLGYEGSTGNSTGCHLHFEVDQNNTPLNPLAYLS
ncbi:MAG: peptidoglycan DD-metalloendopeptidase family protein [Candidatus Dormibacteraeota bacterium]|nr:peptidoglycan DD-metalloendopeptidase family protein [Candidatus Dormibacteraeota bacterium]